MRNRVLFASVVLVLGGGLVAPVTAVAVGGRVDLAGQLDRVSVSSSEGQADSISGRSSRPEVNGDGTVVAFDSIATDLVSGDTNLADDVFVRDRTRGRTTRVSVSSSGRQANGDSTRAVLSNDGRFVVFESDATNLVAGDTNNRSDIFLRDRANKTTSLLSLGAHGQPADDSSFSPTISGNGHVVAFTSNATNLTRDAPGGGVFVRALRTGHTSRVTVRPDGTPAPAGGASASISFNGRYIAFGSFGSDLVAGDTNDFFDVFVRDRRTHQTTRVSLDSNGGQAEGGDSIEPSISANGRTVAFASDATNLVPTDTNGVRDIFVHNAETGATNQVDVATDGSQSNGQSDGPGIRGGLTFGPDISGDGRYVVFDSVATNLIDHDTNTCSFPPNGPTFPDPGQCPDIFRHDLKLGTTTRASVTSNGDQANDASTDPAISSDGRSVVFFSAASNFVADDTNTCKPFFTGHPGQCPDIYLNHG